MSAKTIDFVVNSSDCETTLALYVLMTPEPVLLFTTYLLIRFLVSQDGSLKWDTLTQGQVLGSYYYGYAVSKIPTGWALVRHVSGKNLILASSVVATVISLVTPIVAVHSAIASVCLRVLLGICGVSIPVRLNSDYRLGD